MAYEVTRGFTSRDVFDLAALLKQVAQAHPDGYSVTLTDAPEPVTYAAWADLAAAADDLDFEQVSEARVSGPDLSYAVQFWASESAAADGSPEASSVTLVCIDPVMNLSLDAFTRQIEAVVAAWSQALDGLGYAYDDEDLSNLDALRSQLATA